MKGDEKSRVYLYLAVLPTSHLVWCYRQKIPNKNIPIFLRVFIKIEEATRPVCHILPTMLKQHRDSENSCILLILYTYTYSTYTDWKGASYRNNRKTAFCWVLISLMENSTLGLCFGLDQLVLHHLSSGDVTGYDMISLINLRETQWTYRTITWKQWSWRYIIKMRNFWRPSFETK